MLTSGRRLLPALRKHRALYLLMLPGILYYILFKYVPMYGIIIAFQDYSVGKGILGSKFVGFKHFAEFFYVTPDAWKLIRNTVLLNVYDLLFHFPAPIILAILFHEIRITWFKRLVQSISYMPHFLSTVVIAGILVTFLSPSTGVVNHALERLFGLEPIMFLGEPGWFRTIYVGSEIWQKIGWGTILYLAAISGIDPTLYEAAKMDGASRFRQVRHITLVGMVPVMIVLFVLTLGHFMEIGFQKILLLYNSMNYETSDVINTFVYRRGILDADFSFATAVGLFQSVIGLVLVVTANRIVRKHSGTSLW
ncbi:MULTISPECIES: ABC transporter permease subunit [unclassified Paenibacillus]|uniref:ABC transporter permease n=1 Tax=unclassified Paenibacillus TaxID=185978 RepID=UPI0009575101|nr:MULTISPECIES: ABC transporter permease subunit [unclassified Paenibacillus]ASS68361.1 sugar ABC transporter permease [Paenibacillus sp. RUD330]SIR30498.1 putative aldouronate transport system permease protein [Paenibacillus sp. RU4X]SIR42245.1 putative aldouronate transport system permease protein [Paenibacillus sp. RU4T]